MAVLGKLRCGARRVSEGPVRAVHDGRRGWEPDHRSKCESTLRSRCELSLGLLQYSSFALCRRMAGQGPEQTRALACATVYLVFGTQYK